MEKVNINNYEEFALDYLEGNLSRERSEMFEKFLIEHPDIAVDIDGLSKELPVLSASEDFFSDKSRLYRTAGYTKILLWAGSAAAVLIFGVILTALWNIDRSHSGENISAPPDIVSNYPATEITATEHSGSILSPQGPLSVFNEEMVANKEDFADSYVPQKGVHEKNMAFSAQRKVYHRVSADIKPLDIDYLLTSIPTQELSSMEIFIPEFDGNIFLHTIIYKGALQEISNDLLTFVKGINPFNSVLSRNTEDSISIPSVAAVKKRNNKE
ncbi:MAG: hypothetical protein LIO79_02380 [Rikenellaceae bacterium]|nr:hypothetical protein [Rikenellaceae bacterium]